MTEESNNFLPNEWKYEGQNDVCIPGLASIYIKAKGKIPLPQTIHTDFLQESKHFKNTLQHCEIGSQVLKKADPWKQHLKSDRAKVHLIGTTSWAGLKWIPLMNYHVCIYTDLEKLHNCWHKYLCILLSLSSEIQNFPRLFYDFGNFSPSQPAHYQ